MTSGTPWDIGAYDVETYLDQIGVVDAHRAPLDLDLVRRIYGGHVRTYPFSNVQVLLGDHPGVTAHAVQQSIVERHRGGYCFEHSQLFAGVLQRLGFSVDLFLGRVHSPDNSRTHLSVVVTVGDHSYLCDPGFGFSLREPMLISENGEHIEGDRTFTLVKHGSAASEVWELQRDGEPQHFTDRLPVMPVDVRSGHLVTSTAGFGPFTEHLMVMRHTAEGHVTVTEEARTFRSAGQSTRREELDPVDTATAVEALGVHMTSHEKERLAERIADLQNRSGAPSTRNEI
ncbi:arylamine N-acetyltransferase family protein [Rothia uropygialis]|uniref:arylamine N-acetyltransferase family protein n=1 Tax=Kocuria sp. 36 TaxID=1415402 RepID=UPI0013ED1C5F|nr:arylamine N-acetyltransferase [Kocuria sp. 36]